MKTECSICHEVKEDGLPCDRCGFKYTEDKTISDRRGFALPRTDVNVEVYRSAEKRVTKTAGEIVQQAANEISQRASLRDQAAGERSMARAVASFNALLGREALNETEGWLFMCVLKMARATAGKHHLDDYIDLAGYAGLAGECAEMKAANDDEVMHFNVDYGKYGTDG